MECGKAVTLNKDAVMVHKSRKIDSKLAQNTSENLHQPYSMTQSAMTLSDHP